MQDEMQKAVTDNIGDIATMTKEGIMKAVEVLQEQCPLLVSEVLKWEACKSALWFLLGIALFGVAAKTTKHILIWAKKELDGDDEEWVPLGFAIIFLCGSPVVMMLCNLAWLQIWIAPRLFLLEYVTGLIK